MTTATGRQRSPFLPAAGVFVDGLHAATGGSGPGGHDSRYRRIRRPDVLAVVGRALGARARG